MGLSRTIVSFALITAFIIGIIGFAMNFAVDNNSAVNIADDDDVYSLYNSSVQQNSSYGSSANNTYASIVNSTIDPVGQTIVSGGVFTFGIGDYWDVFNNMIGLVFTKIFGGNKEFAVFFSIFAGVLLILISYYIISAWLGRNPD